MMKENGVRISAVLDGRELATVLAALRYWQGAMGGSRRINFGELADLVATDQGTVHALSVTEIDALCEHLGHGCGMLMH
jgi:hypothetical protein